MWWVFGIAIWIVLGVISCYLYKIDWNNMFHGDGWDFDNMWFFYIISIILPPVSLIAVFIMSHDIGKMMEIFFGEIGDWFKDHTDWRW